MYGMINQAVRKLVVENHGEPVWQKICAEAGLTETDFSSMQKYPDEVTYKLVAAASKVLNAPAEQVLEAFGEYWTDFAKQTSFARLLQFGGRSMQEFVNNLDQMHAKIKFSLPDLEPPMFRATDVTPDGFRLHYYSKRQGLAPVVVGMMKGVAKIYGTGIDMKLVRGKADGHDHDEFSVTYVPMARAAAE